jgi:uncharacterized membrane protein
MKASEFFTKEQKNQIVSAIKEAEKNTSGEIRVHIESNCKIDVLDRAAYIFKKLEMHKTALRNGVLFYLAVNDKKFAILGDAGINAVVPDNFWEDVKNIMAEYFKKSEFTEGLTKGISLAGELLKKYFPYKSDDINELSDEISFNNKNK